MLGGIVGDGRVVTVIREDHLRQLGDLRPVFHDQDALATLR